MEVDMETVSGTSWGEDASMQVIKMLQLEQKKNYYSMALWFKFVNTQWQEGKES